MTSTDFRRLAGFLLQGASRLVIYVQAGMEDIEGAIADAQYDVALLQTRRVLLECLAIRSAADGGRLTWSRDDLSFDYATGTDQDSAREADELLAEMIRAAAASAGDREAAMSRALGRLEAYVAATEGLLELREGLPLLRSAEGFFAGIRAARDMSVIQETFGLPQFLPGDWTA